MAHGPVNRMGSFPCKGAGIAPGRRGACDLCKHVEETGKIKSPYDKRTWSIRENISCNSFYIIYLIICTIHNSFYVGSAKEICKRWRNHRSHFKNKCVTSCGLSRHAALFPHPEIVDSRPVDFLKVVFLETVKAPRDLLKREVWWQLNFGTLSGKNTEVFSGLNDRKDFNAI